MTYAIIGLAGKQFKVSKGDTFVTNKLSHEEGDTFSTSDVYLLVDGDEVIIGEPLIEKASVKLKVVDHHKSKKLRVAKFRSKSRYRKVYGHRQHQSTVEVVSITK